MDGVPIPFSLEKLPYRADLHEAESFLLDPLHLVEKIERLLVVLREPLLEIPFEAHVTPVQHVRIDVGPNLGQVRNVPDLAIEIGRGRNRHAGAYLRAARLRKG